MKLRCSNPTLLIYLGLVYVVPALLNTLLSYEPDVYLNPSSSFVTWLYGGLMFAITAAFAFRLDFKSGRRTWYSPILWEVPLRRVIGLLISLLVLATIGAVIGLSQWRYASEGLSASLDPLSLLFVLAPNVLELILFTLLFFHYHLAPRITRTIFLMLVICLALTATGIGPMINVLIALVALVLPLTFRRLLLNASTTQNDLRVWPKRILLFPLVSFLGFLAYFVGDAIKTGSSLGEVMNSAAQGQMDVFLDYLVGRFSVNWYSLNATLHAMVELGVGEPLRNLMSPLTNAGFRLSSLTGGLLGIERPLDGSMARINYGLVSPNPFNDREGTSPGLIGSFVLAFPIWLGPFALAGYLWAYNKVQSGLRCRFAGRPTLFGELLILYFTMFFFSSPVDFLLLFDPMLLSLVAFCYLGLSVNTKFLHHATIQPSY